MMEALYDVGSDLPLDFSSRPPASANWVLVRGLVWDVLGDCEGGNAETGKTGYMQITSDCDELSVTFDGDRRVDTISYRIPQRADSIRSAVVDAMKHQRCFPLLKSNGDSPRYIGLFRFSSVDFPEDRIFVSLKVASLQSSSTDETGSPLSSTDRAGPPLSTSDVGSPPSLAEKVGIPLYTVVLPVRRNDDIFFGHGPQVLEMCLECIDLAQTKLRISLYQIDNCAFEKAVVRAIHRGVLVRCMLQHRPPPNVPVPAMWLPFLGKGLDLCLIGGFQSEDGLHRFGAMHAKMQIADFRLAVLTSMNPTKAGTTVNIEHACFVTEEARVERVVAQFDSVWSRLTLSGGVVNV